jgi:hypothetical protein
MATQVDARIHRAGGNRHFLYLRSDLMGDSSFPFEAGDEVTIRIEKGCLVVFPKSTLPPASVPAPPVTERTAPRRRPTVSA